MPRLPRLTGLNTLRVACAATALWGTTAHAVNLEWTGDAGDGLWGSPANWVVQGTSTVSGFPDAQDAALFGSSATIGGLLGNGDFGRALDVDISLQDGVVLTLADRFELADGSITGLGANQVIEGQNSGRIERVTTYGPITLGSPSAPLAIGSGTLTNHGTLTARGVSVGGGSRPVLAGDGALVLAGTISGPSPFSAILANELGHTIEGAGTFKSLTLTNRGLINLTGALTLDNARLNGGLIHGEVGAVLLDASSARGTLQGDITTTGTITLGGVAQVGPSLGSAAITNQGTLIVRDIRLSGGARPVLAGDGTLVLDGRIRGTSPTAAVLANEVGHTIQGAGTLTNLTLANRGRINLTGALTLDNARVEGGVIHGEAGGALLADRFGNGRLQGDITTTGDIIFGGVADAAPSLGSAAITNQGTLIARGVRLSGGARPVLAGNGTLVLGGTISGPSSTSAILTNEAGHTIEGAGTLRNLTLRNLGTVRWTGNVNFNGASVAGETGDLTFASSTGVTFGDVLQSFQQRSIGFQSPDATLTFTGERLSFDHLAGNLETQSTLGIDFTQGVVFEAPTVFAPGAAGVGTAEITGDLIQASLLNTIELEFARGVPGTFDQIVIGGDASLQGTLDIVRLDGFEFSNGEFLEIIRIDGQRNGFFRTADGQVLAEGALLPGLDAEVLITYQAGDGNDIALRVVPEPGAASTLFVGGLIAMRRRRCGS
ncbi:MAG: hypothetical protein AAF288_07940 [Planctomycetota bacterium]